MTDDEIQGLLRDLRDDPVPADSLARVRMRVTERTSRRGWRVWWVPAMAVVWLVLTVVLWPYRVIEPVAPPAPAVVAQSPKPTASVHPVIIATVRPPKPRPRAGSASSHGSIRIETADPDVVLIFLTDGGGE